MTWPAGTVGDLQTQELVGVSLSWAASQRSALPCSGLSVGVGGQCLSWLSLLPEELMSECHDHGWTCVEGVRWLLEPLMVTLCDVSSPLVLERIWKLATAAVEPSTRP